MPRNLFVRTLAALIVLAAMASAAAANEPRQHDRGLFLRLSAGAGQASTGATDSEGEDTEFSGLSGDANFAIGAIVAPNLAIHATFFGWSAFEPDYEVGGVEFETEDVTLSMNAIGAGVTYYLGESNFYLSGSVGAATMELEWKNDNITIKGDSDTGLALDATVGKEWWVGQRWGIGVAADFGYHSIPTDDEDFDDNLTGTNFGVRFSATFN